MDSVNQSDKTTVQQFSCIQILLMLQRSLLCSQKFTGCLGWNLLILLATEFNLSQVCLQRSSKYLLQKDKKQTQGISKPVVESLLFSLHFCLRSNKMTAKQRKWWRSFSTNPRTLEKQMRYFSSNKTLGWRKLSLFFSNSHKVLIELQISLYWNERLRHGEH